MVDAWPGVNERPIFGGFDVKRRLEELHCNAKSVLDSRMREYGFCHFGTILEVVVEMSLSEPKAEEI